MYTSFLSTGENVEHWTCSIYVVYSIIQPVCVKSSIKLRAPKEYFMELEELICFLIIFLWDKIVL